MRASHACSDRRYPFRFLYPFDDEDPQLHVEVDEEDPRTQPSPQLPEKMPADELDIVAAMHEAEKSKGTSWEDVRVHDAIVALVQHAVARHPHFMMGRTAEELALLSRQLCLASQVLLQELEVFFSSCIYSLPTTTSHAALCRFSEAALRRLKDVVSMLSACFSLFSFPMLVLNKFVY